MRRPQAALTTSGEAVAAHKRGGPLWGGTAPSSPVAKTDSCVVVVRLELRNLPNFARLFVSLVVPLQRVTRFLWLPSTKKKPAEADGHKQQAHSHRKRAGRNQNRRGNRRPTRGNPTQTKQPKHANHRKPPSGTRNHAEDDAATPRNQRRAARNRHKNRAADERDAKPTRRKHGTRPPQQANNETHTTADDSGTPDTNRRSGNGRRQRRTNADGDAGRRTATTNTSQTKERTTNPAKHRTGQPLHCAGAHRRKAPTPPANGHNYSFTQRPCP